MERFTKPLLVCVIVAFAALGINNVVSTKNRIELRDVQLKSTTSELKTLQLKYDHLNLELDKTDAGNAEQIKKLQDEKTKLEQERDELQKQVSLKQEAARVAAAKLNSTASLGGTAYAAGDSKMFIYMKESGNNPGAINRSSGACGLGQALPCSKMPCSLSDYACQDNYFTGYMQSRYGTWDNAAAFWRANQWW